MDFKLSEIQVDDYYAYESVHMLCKCCQIIDCDLDRMRVGYVCSTCGEVTDGAMLAFPINIQILIEQIQTAFHIKSPKAEVIGSNYSNISTVLFFCVLKEAIINLLLKRAMEKNMISADDIRKILKNEGLQNKFGKIFTLIFRISWKDAVNEASRISGINFDSIVDVMNKAIKLRNNFLHESYGYEISREFASQCIDALPEMLNLFVILHNRYVYTINQVKMRR